MTRQNNCLRCKIVRGYLAKLEDDTLRLLCFLYSQGYSDSTVRRTLHINRPRLAELKKSIADALIEAGLERR